ncbi:MAG: hypothetical protein ABFR65_10410, partial [Pseudomonadota bacterium]
MKRPSTRQRRIVILSLALLTFGIAYLGGNRYTTPDQPQVSGVLLQPATPVAEFELEDQYGDPFGRGQLDDHWSLILLDPAGGVDTPGLRRLVQVHNRLAGDPRLQIKTRFIYLPRRNSDAIATAVSRLGGSFSTLRGEPVEIDALFTAF